MVEKIRYCIDLQALQGESRHRGIGRYTHGLASAVVRSERVEPFVLLNTALQEGFYEARDWAREFVSDSNCKIFTGPDRIMGLLPDVAVRERRAAILYDGFVSSLGLDWLHNSAPFDGMGDDTTIGQSASGTTADCRKVATLYDLIPFQEPDIHLLDPRYRLRYYSRLETLRSFDLLFAISDYTRGVAIEQFGFPVEKVVAISTDTSPEFRPLNLSSMTRSIILKKYGITRPFLIHTGILEIRKNVRRLVDAFSLLPSEIRNEYQIVFAGNATAAQIADLSVFARSVGLRSEDLVFAGFVPDKDLAVLYNVAEVLVMPSYSEGFGLPLLEAMRCGAPVLGADATAIPEVIGSRRYLFDPNSSADLANSLHLLLTNSDAKIAAREHSRLQQARFSWQSSADRALDAVYDKQRECGTKFHRVPRFPLAAKTDDFALARKQLPPEWTITLDQTEGLPAVVVGEREFTIDQEHLLVKEAFVLFGLEERVSTRSPTLKYLVDGYARLYEEKDADRFQLDVSKINVFPNAVFATSASASTSGSANAGDISHKVSCFKILTEVVEKISEGLSDDEAAEMSQYVFANLVQAKRGPVLFLDITELVKKDAGTGIQRVVRNVLFHLITADIPIRVEAIFRDGDRYRYARRFCANMLHLRELNLADDYVYFSAGDIFLGLDLDALVNEAAMNRLRVERMRGVKLVWVVYDILPVKRPEWFDQPLAEAVQKWFKNICIHADQLVCISRSVADDVDAYVEGMAGARKYDLGISWWHLGADLDVARASILFESAEIAQLPKGIPIFLTVGTIEPRKGIAKLLDNADILWAEGRDICFVLVGRRGWSIETTIRRIASHPEFGRRLIWFESLSDEALNLLYAQVTAVILPSEGEGFGLPLVEAALHGTPIIARDIPVFREIGQDGVYYFRNDVARGMADGVMDWLGLAAKERHPRPTRVQIQTWRDSSLNLLGVLSAQPYKLIESGRVRGGNVSCLPIQLDLGDAVAGSARIRLKMATRHFCSVLPLHERVSHRLNLEWLVTSTTTGKVLTVLSQSEHSYEHLEFFTILPDDRFITLIPCCPYIADASPVADVIVDSFTLNAHAYRYEVEIGASSDSRLIGDGWSYREGHLPFEHWFHNKAFRWAFDGAELSLPVVIGRPIHVNLNALCRTVVEVWTGNVLLTTLLPISDAQRWHDERYHFIVPAELINSNNLLIEFRFAKDAMNLIDFNLRQSTFALSRIIVDVFEGGDASLFERVANAAWSEDLWPNILALSKDLRCDNIKNDALPQVGLLVAEIEFEIVETYFAPHSSFWNAMRGLKGTAEREGISSRILSSNRVPPENAFEAIVLGPIRFDTREVERIRALSGGYQAALLVPTIPTLALFDVTLDDTILNGFGYREIYDVPLAGGIKGNFWEIMPTESTQWRTSLLTAFDATVIGQRAKSDALWLSTASAEDWFEMGDPGSETVMSQFWNFVATPNIAATGSGPCTLWRTDAEIIIYAPETRIAVRSFGGGIARGWAKLDTDFPTFASLTYDLKIDFDKLPRKGNLARQLKIFERSLTGLKVTLGSLTVAKNEEPRADEG